MKKIFLFLFLHVVLTGYTYAQVIPKGMNYQAVARNLDGDLIANEKVGLKILLFSNKDGQRVDYYGETHEATTNALGLFNLIIGEGVKEKGEYGLIPWNEENIWLEVSIQDKAHTRFALLSSSKLMAVPYAIHAGSTDKILESKESTKTSSFAPPEPGVISTEWSVLGNSKTDASGNIYRINSLGTSDYVDLIMITDNVERLRILGGGNIVTKLNFEVGKNANIGQNLYVLQNATFCDTLIVKKNVVLNTMGGSTFNYGPFTVANLSPTYLTGSLTVDQSTYINTSFNVDRSTNLNNRLNVNKKSPTKLSGTLVVNKTTVLNGAVNVNNISPTYLSGKLIVDSCATFINKVKILSQYSTDTSGLFPTGSLQVHGGAYIKENLFVGGITKFAGPAVFGASVSINDLTQSTSPITGALVVGGGTGIGLNLNVGGMAMIGGMTTILDNTQSLNTTSGALKVFGGVGIRKRLNVNGTALFQKSLTVFGPTNIGNTLNITNSNNFVTDFINMSGPNGISIQVGNAMPGWANNFIEFRNGTGGVVGRIEGENSSQYMLNQKYINELAVYNTAILQAELLVASTAIDLAAAIAGIVTAATSATLCAGLGVCTTSPIPSMIIKSVLKAALYVGAVAIVSYLLVSAHDNKDAYITYKTNRIGVTYESGSGDYAEWLPKINNEEMLLPGYIVGMKNGKISKNTQGMDKLLAISTKPIVLGNAPEQHNKAGYEKVAFMGQVPVYVSGKVNAGDYILPSGRNNGFGKAVSPSQMKAEDYSKIVGVAWSASTDESPMINVGIGLNAGDISKVVKEQNKMIQELESQFSESNIALGMMIPEFKKAAKDAGIDVSVGSTPALVQNKTGSISNLSFLGSPLTNLNLFELSNEQVLTLLDMAVNSFTSDGGSLDSNEFLNRLKSDPVYKKDFIQDIQSTYKKEVQYQIEKWRPSH